MTKTISGYKELPNFVEQISLGEFLPAHYRIRVALIVQNREILFETEEFDVTHAESIARPWIYSQLLSESPSFEVHVLLGESYRELGNHEKAIEVFDKAIRLYGVNTLVLNALGGCYFSLGRVSEALSAWEKSLDMNPEQPEIRKNIKPLKKRRRKRIRRKDDKKFVG